MCPPSQAAVEKYLHDLEHGQQRKDNTVQHRNLLEKRLQPWCGPVAALQRPAQARRACDARVPGELADSPYLRDEESGTAACGFFPVLLSRRNGWRSNAAASVKALKVGKAAERVKVFTAADITTHPQGVRPIPGAELLRPRQPGAGAGVRVDAALLGAADR